MKNIVLKMNSQQINELKHYYQSVIKDSASPSSLFVAKPASCTITAYQSGKVLFQGNNCEVEAKKWEHLQTEMKKTSYNKRQSTHLPKSISTLSVIGSDEVGTGDFFGPITVVAAYVNKKQIPLLEELGVKDSKHLNDTKIISIGEQLRHCIPFSLLSLHNEKYNELQAKGMTQGKMKALLHNKAISNVLKKIEPEKPEAILIDQFVEKETYFRHIKNEPVIQTENVYFSTRAESVHLAVASASIIARYAFIRHIEKLSNKAGFTIPKGAGATVDIAAARLIKEKGKNILPQFVKLHFANTHKALQIAEKNK